MEKLAKEVLKYAAAAYAVSMLFVMPLYAPKGYYLIGEYKYALFRNISVVLVPICVVSAVVLLLSNYRQISKGQAKGQNIIQNTTIEKSSSLRSFLHGLKKLDTMMLFYALAVSLSFLCSPYRYTAFWGYAGWYMGLFSQLIFVGSYFLITRCLQWKSYYWKGTMVVSSIVFLLGGLNRFSVDPAGMFRSVSVHDWGIDHLLSTIGNINWYSGYLCLVFPLTIFLYWNSSNMKTRIITGIFTFIGFFTALTQGSEGAYLSIGIVMLVLLWFSFDNRDSFLRFLEILVIMAAAFALNTLLSDVFWRYRNFPVDSIVLRVLDSHGLYGIFTGFLFLYVNCIFLYRQEKLTNETLKKLKKVLLLLSLAIFCVLFTIMALHTIQPRWFAFINQIPILNFTDEWGSNRGLLWKRAIRYYSEFPLIYKFIGIGPDSFAQYAYTHHLEEMTAVWNSTVTNVHNEFLNTLFNFGILGFVSHVGIFVAFGKECLAAIKQDKRNISFLLCITGYVVHSFVSFQQIIITPLMFVCLAMFVLIQKNPSEIV